MRNRSSLIRRLFVMAIATLILAAFGTSISFAQDAPTAEDFASLKIGLDTSWVMITGFLVFFMQLGFAILETGMISQRGAVNALLENFIEAGVGALCWWFIGFGLAFGVDNGSGLFGTSLFMPGVELADTIFYGNISVLTMFFFQFAFAATASTITTGAMAERTDFVGNLIYTVIVTVFIYPIVVHWVWGGGWLFQRGFIDFAGSNVVHTVGGVIALLGAIFLGPRKDKVWGKMVTPHNLGLALIGTLILWVGWYGFNPGSTLGIVGVAGTVGIVVLNTTMGGGVGLLSAMFFQYFRSGKWDLAVTLNGSLAGLVAVTAGCAFVSPLAAIIMGAVGGIIVILWGDLLERLKIDDAVGASSVHLACGVWGILAVGLFAEPSLIGFAANPANATWGGLLIPGGGIDLLVTQFIGSVSTIIWCVVTGSIMFGALKAMGRLRVNKIADTIGIDMYEHGASIWPDILPVPEEIDGSAKSIPTGATQPSGD
ncbi:MAG: ammonium transporter [Anaerolineae bacterium]|jgi:Amt family ammonium transporter|nr:ammonium transporter [Anaerolineae bacterium]